MNKENEIELRKHKFIVFCSDHYNSLGVVRSLGEAAILKVILVCYMDGIKENVW